jgi:hypothetical protein
MIKGCTLEAWNKYIHGQQQHNQLIVSVLT